MDQQKNLIIAIAASLIILLGFQYLVEAPRARERQAALATQQASQPAPQPGAASGDGQAPAGGAPSAGGPALPGALTSPGAGPGLAPGAPLAVERSRGEILAASPRVAILTPRLIGSINLKGGRIDDLVLSDYHETVDRSSPSIALLNPAGRKDAYYGDFGWWTDQRDMKMPGADTQWTADATELSPGKPVTLSWENGQGLRFTRRYEIDDRYMITVHQQVQNLDAAPLSLLPYALVARAGFPETQGFFILHEGLIGVMNDTLREVGYKDLKGEAKKEEATTGGWIGLTDKYWLVALIPSAAETVKTTMQHYTAGGVDRFQVDYLGSARHLAAGASVDSTHRLFAGAKEVKTLRDYQDTLNIQRFDYAVDWGWFYFLTRLFFDGLSFINKHIGNFGISILIFTLLLKVVFFPLANKSYVMMGKMKNLGPKMTEMREKYANDRERMNQELMRLYREEKVNPLSGCLPIVLQIPVFFALYKVLFVTIEMRHTPFFGWIRDLSAPDPTTVFNLFGLIPWDPPSMLMLGVWPLIMGATMWVQQKLNPPPPDPIQAKIFAFMPFIFTFMLASFPAGLVIYWAWNNLLSIAQQWLIMRRIKSAEAK